MESDDEIQYQVRHHVVVRLAAADARDGRSLHGNEISRVCVEVVSGAKEIAGGERRAIRVHISRLECVQMRRKLLDIDRHAGRTGGFTEIVSIAKVHRHTAPQIRQSESRLTVPTIGRAEQREEGLILIDRQELPVAKRPAFRGIVKRDDLDLGEKWFCHWD